jgi:hypothetical protein
MEKYRIGRPLGGAVLTWALFAASSGCGAVTSGDPRAPVTWGDPRPPVTGAPPSAHADASAAGPVHAGEAELPALRVQATDAAAQRHAGASRGGAAAAPPVAPALPRNTSVLHVGDSFVLAGFSQGLRARMEEVGARYRVKSEQSSYTVTWAARLEQLLTDTKPDLVIITLGANEVANVDPPSHAYAVRRIARLVGDRPCVWVLPPLWRKDTGIIDVIRQNSAPCRLFDSDAQVRHPIPRQSDKIHPTKEGGQIWADAFWAWLEAERAVAAAGGSRSQPWALGPAAADEHVTRGAEADRQVQASSAIDDD